MSDFSGGVKCCIRLDTEKYTLFFGCFFVTFLDTFCTNFLSRDTNFGQISDKFSRILHNFHTPRFDQIRHTQKYASISSRCNFVKFCPILTNFDEFCPPIGALQGGNFCPILTNFYPFSSTGYWREKTHEKHANIQSCKTSENLCKICPNFVKFVSSPGKKIFHEIFVKNWTDQILR